MSTTEPLSPLPSEEISTTICEKTGLIKLTVKADDGHPLRVYTRKRGNESKQPLGAVLMLHGRTWSAMPMYELRTSDDDKESYSLLQTLSSMGFVTYTFDFRGFGETPRDYFGYVTP